MQRLQAYRVFHDVQVGSAEDEIAGTDHGLPLSIVEARLERGSGSETTVVFDGLLIELISAAGAGRDDRGASRLGSGRQPQGAVSRWSPRAVRLEDPVFEKHYQVFASNQIEARALLTPAFMQRFTELARRSGLSLPGAVVEGNRFLVAMPKRDNRDLFEPPPYWKPAGWPRPPAVERRHRRRYCEWPTRSSSSTSSRQAGAQTRTARRRFRNENAGADMRPAESIALG